MATPRIRPEAPAGEMCPGLASTAGNGRVSKPHGAVSFMSPPRAGDAWGEEPDLVRLEAQGLKGPALQPRRRLQPTHLFPFGSRVSFEAGESWGALWGRRGAQSSCPQPRPLPPPLGAPGERPDSPWVLGGHRGPGLQGDLVHPETQSTLHMSPTLAIPTPLPQQPPRPRPTPPPGPLTTGPGIPRRPSGPGFPGAPWGPMGPVFPGGPSKPASPCREGRVGPRRLRLWSPPPRTTAQKPRGALARTLRAPDTQGLPPTFLPVEAAQPHPLPTEDLSHPGSSRPAITATTAVTASSELRVDTLHVLSRRGLGELHHLSRRRGTSTPGGGTQTPPRAPGQSGHKGSGCWAAAP